MIRHIPLIRDWFHSLSSTQKEVFMGGTDVLGTLIVAALYLREIVPMWFLLLSIALTVVDILGLRLLVMAMDYFATPTKTQDEYE